MRPSDIEASLGEPAIKVAVYQQQQLQRGVFVPY
jgi:hypothetical protein